MNRIMTVLTVVTVIFMPLTLIVGWYGMNFVYMPELHWRYSYLVVFIVSALILIGGVIWCKNNVLIKYRKIQIPAWIKYAACVSIDVPSKRGAAK